MGQTQPEDKRRVKSDNTIKTTKYYIQLTTNILDNILVGEGDTGSCGVHGMKCQMHILWIHFLISIHLTKFCQIQWDF